MADFAVVIIRLTIYHENSIFRFLTRQLKHLNKLMAITFKLVALNNLSLIIFKQPMTLFLPI